MIKRSFNIYILNEKKFLKTIVKLLNPKNFEF